ncbi:MAG: mechanosensitive ion channel family protein [Elusimicrobiales bacterium]|nr:mechanosensitive ion channel family protein [Elusimicrobiales bacterium]
MAFSHLVHHYAAPLSLLAGGALLGLVFEKVALSRLQRMAEKTDWEGDDIIIASLKGVTLLWFILLGFYCAASAADLAPKVFLLVHKTLLVVWLLSATAALSKIATGFVRLYSGKGRGALPSTSILTNITRIAVFVLGALIMLQSLGISITPLLTALGVGGLAVALALQDTLTNLFAGVQILLSRQVAPGDYVKLDSDFEGTITDVNWRNTIITAVGNNNIIIPNAKLASSIVTNYNRPTAELSVLVGLGVAHGSDLAKVERVTAEIAGEVQREVEGGVKEFSPFIRYSGFTEYGVQFNVILRGEDFNAQYLLRHEFIKRLSARYEKEGIRIPFPARSVYLEKR